MHASRFDIAVVGDSLAARMVAAILAKHGKRVLFFSAPACRETWHGSSLFLDKVMASLGGHDRITPAQPFQVLSSRARVTVSPGRPLLDELTREFGTDAPAISGLLAGLKTAGNAVEVLLDENDGLPAEGLATTARWRWLCMRRKLPLGDLAAPLAGRLQGFSAPATEWLRDLFQGLALRPLDTLTVADGALLWTYAVKPEAVTDEALRLLLHKRFDQFHGVETTLDNLRFCEHGGGHWTLSLQGGGQYKASQLIIGDLGREIPGRGVPLPRHAQIPAQHFATSALDGQLSPLLTARFIPGGPLPMRCAVNATSAELTGQIGTLAAADEDQVRQQLSPFLPFARYDLARETVCLGTAASGLPSTVPALFKLPFRLGNHLHCADEARLLPQLGTGGTALLAWTLIRQIEPDIK